jgi:hypothetical protein
MDYAVDFFYENNESNNESNNEYVFIYDDPRYFSKFYVFFKSLGFAVYVSTLTTCNIPDFYIFMMGIMGLSTFNSVRYEYKHYKRYGTVFYSLMEYRSWKKDLWPKSRIIFSVIELAVKIGFFIKTFPPEFDFHTSCNAGQSIFNIHILLLFIVYIVSGIFTASLFVSFYCCQYCHSLTTPVSNTRTVLHNQRVSLPVIGLMQFTTTHGQNEECCICLDVNCNQTWVFIPCGHKFHASCVSRWIETHHTCPVCRFDMRVIV